MLKLIRSSRRLFKLNKNMFSTTTTEVTKNQKDNQTTKDSIMTYQNGELIQRTALVLKSKENIEDYVFKLIKEHFRTTFTDGLVLESVLSEHGLDSLDAIEFAMQIEEDLGYVVPAENLAIFTKVKHYVNFIEQIEFFKQRYNKNPGS